MRRAAHQFAQIVADGANVGAAPAADGHQHAVVGHFAMEVDALHVYLAQGNLHTLAPAGALVHGHAILLDGAVHAGPLPDIADELPGGRLHRLIAGIAFAGGNDLAGGVLGIGGHAKGALGHVFLFLVHQIIEKPRSLAYHHRQHAGGFRVQRSGVADPLFPRQAANLRHHSGGGHARRLEDIQKSIHRSNLIGWFYSWQQAPHPPPRSGRCAGCSRRPGHGRRRQSCGRSRPPGQAPRHAAPF